jgi:hypothetical protein
MTVYIAFMEFCLDFKATFLFFSRFFLLGIFLSVVRFRRWDPILTKPQFSCWPPPGVFNSSNRRSLACPAPRSDSDCSPGNDCAFIFVSAFWPVSTWDKGYSMHVPRFFRVFRGELYFYSTRAYMARYNITAPNIHVRYTYATPWEIPCIARYRDEYRRQQLLDDQPGIHRTAELYAIWNSKVCLVCDVSCEHPNSVVFWIDAGSLREQRYENIAFPNKARMREVLPDGTTQGKMIFTFFQGKRIPRLFPLRKYGNDWVGAIGGFFGGDFPALTDFYNQFWFIHDTLLAGWAFIGAEQELFTTYMVYANETWIQPNWHASSGDPWFATWSFWTDPGISFPNRPRLISSREVIIVDPKLFPDHTRS